MKIYGGQLDIAWENKDENFHRVRNLLNTHKLAQRSLVVLPEMFATGFTMNTDTVAEADGGSTDCFLRELAREKGVHILGGLPRLASRRRILNEAVCFAPSGKRIARYAKLHLFSPGNESQHYTPGNALTLFRWGQFTVGLFICYDLRFPEIFRMAVQRGANLLVVIASWPARRHSHWTALLRVRAIENQAYILGVNRCGDDPQANYQGGSVVFNPWGETVAEAGQGETLLSADLDLALVNRVRKDFPVWRDARSGCVLKKIGRPVKIRNSTRKK